MLCGIGGRNAEDKLSIPVSRLGSEEGGGSFARELKVQLSELESGSPVGIHPLGRRTFNLGAAAPNVPLAPGARKKTWEKRSPFTALSQYTLAEEKRLQWVFPSTHQSAANPPLINTLRLRHLNTRS